MGIAFDEQVTGEDSDMNTYANHEMHRSQNQNLEFIIPGIEEIYHIEDIIAEIGIELPTEDFQFEPIPSAEDYSMLFDIMSGLEALSPKWSEQLHELTQNPEMAAVKTANYWEHCNQYGYTNVDGEMVIVPEQAEIVKQIFTDCLNGKSTSSIAKGLNEKGIPSRKGKRWNEGVINGILINEKYTGAALYQKTYTDENFKRKRNHGEENQYYCENHHEAIIDQDTFEKAKVAIKQRGIEKGNCGEDTSKYMNRYAMSGKIKCGECGRNFKRRYHYTTKGKNYIAWCCTGHLNEVQSCSMKYIRDDDLKRIFLTMMNKLRFGSDLVLKPLLIAITTDNSKKNVHSVEEVEKELGTNEEQRKQLNTLLTRGYLERPVFTKAHNKLVMEYEHLIAKRDMLYRMSDSGYTMEQKLKEMVDFLNGAEAFIEWDESLFEKFVEKVKVLSRDEVEFELKFGLKLKGMMD